uniref:Methyltransferase type 11 domain-containing protein n=1 Tax=Prymnesium polylepis TaxID=72548 RepID=A0A7S4HFX0_9EUKA
MIEFLEFFPSHEAYMLGDFVNWDSTGLNSAKDYAMWPSGGPGIVFSSAAVVEFSRIINEHAESMVFQNHDVWLHMLFGRSPHTIKRVHAPGFHQYGFWHFVPHSDPEGARGHAASSGSDLRLVRPTSRTIVSLHFCRDLAALERYHLLVQHLLVGGDRPGALNATASPTTSLPPATSAASTAPPPPAGSGDGTAQDVLAATPSWRPAHVTWLQEQRSSLPEASRTLLGTVQAKLQQGEARAALQQIQPLLDAHSNSLLVVSAAAAAAESAYEHERAAALLENALLLCAPPLDQDYTYLLVAMGRVLVALRRYASATIYLRTVLASPDVLIQQSSSHKMAQELMQVVASSAELKQRSGAARRLHAVPMTALPHSEHRLQSAAHMMLKAARQHAARCGVAAAGCAPRLRVLDVGGGKGHYAAFAEQQGWEYSTIDVETPSTRGSGFNHEWGLHRNSLTYDGRKLPFGAASFDLVIVNFVLHHAAENTIPLLQQIRDIATSFVIIGEDLASQDHPLVWHQRNFEHQPDGVFRSDEEWREIFQLVGLHIESASAVLSKVDLMCEMDDEEYLSKVYRALYVLRTHESLL